MIDEVISDIWRFRAFRDDFVVSAQNEFKQIAMKQTTPSSSVGAAGDGAGMIAWDTNYIYICTAAHDGSTAIWKRVALSTY